jgi:hypothetical protein
LHHLDRKDLLLKELRVDAGYLLQELASLSASLRWLQSLCTMIYWGFEAALT